MLRLKRFCKVEAGGSRGGVELNFGRRNLAEKINPISESGLANEGLLSTGVRWAL